MATERDDLADATYICKTFAAAREWEASTGRAAVQKPLREVLWYVWQSPRLPRPLVRGKYPATGNWTKAARDAYADDPKCRLVIEHVVPMTLLVRELVDHALDPEGIAARLRLATQLCVVTPEENAQLAAAGLGRGLFDSADVWDRYRASGIDPATIAPLRP